MASELRVNTLKDASGNNSVALSTVAEGSAKAWAHIAAGGASLPDSFNFSSIDDDGTGEHGLNFTSAMGSANYSAQATITFNNSGSNNVRNTTVESKAAGAVEKDFAYTNNIGVAIAYDIETDASVAIYGDLA